MTSSVVGKRYQLLTALGAGGMGAVHLALDRLTLETVALKRVALPTYDEEVDPVLAALQAGPDLALALAREFQALASLRHPNIVIVKDYGFDRVEGADDLQRSSQWSYFPRPSPCWKLERRNRSRGA